MPRWPLPEAIQVGFASVAVVGTGFGQAPAVALQAGRRWTGSVEPQGLGFYGTACGSARQAAALSCPYRSVLRGASHPPIGTARSHQVRLMPREYVRPYVKAQKTGDRDAEAIASAPT